jgi:hypothetical protein
MGIASIKECVNNEIYVERGTCRWSFPAQEGHPTVEFINLEEGKIKVVSAKVAVTGLNYSLSGIGCFAKAGAYSNGKWSETITLSARNIKGEKVNFLVE